MGREPARVVAIEREWPRIRAEIDAGLPCVVGLIRVSGSSPWLLSRNHQVLAWAYSAESDEGEARGGRATIRLRVYDPNHPGDDDVALLAEVGADDGRPARERIDLRQSTGEPLLGWFRQPYPPPHGVRAWRPA